MPYLLRDAQGRVYLINGLTRIGREATHPIALNDPISSRLHATVWEEQGMLFLRDESSANGTFVNGKPVQQTVLRPGDIILIGSTTLVVAVADWQPAGRPPASAPPPPGWQSPGYPPLPPQPFAGWQPAGYPPPPPPPARKGSGCGPWLLAGCALTLLVCIILSIGGFVAYQSGWITTATLLTWAGLGPGDIEVDNFRDDTIQVSILQLDVPEDATPAQAVLELNAFDIRNYTAQSPGRYRVDFSASGSGVELGTCTLNVRSGDQYQFVALPEMIVVNRVNNPVATGADLIVATSALCR